tara:strand:+ start:1952 stop:2617 length:666 start_codon:yes stop_codon:yes gene_type:complete
MSLGFLNSTAQMHAPRKTQPPTVALDVSDAESASRVTITHGNMFGNDLIKSTLFGALFLAASYSFVSMGLDTDYNLTNPRIATIVIAAFGGLLCLLIRDTTTLFNTLLGYYIGLEIFLIQLTFENATSTTEAVTEGWSWTAGFVILIHLIPFLLLNSGMLLNLLAYVGLLVNILTILYLVPLYGGKFLLLYGISGSALIVGTVNKSSLSIRQLAVDLIKSR